MNVNILRQFKKVINNNKHVDEYVKLTLADKLHMRKLSREIRKNHGINEITFEDFVLLCKFQKIKATLRVEDRYATRFVNLLHFDVYTLNDIIHNCINDIYEHGDEADYKQVNLDMLKRYMVDYHNNVLLFDKFEVICKKLYIKITIE